MKRFASIALCLLIMVGLCACKKKPDEPVISKPESDVSGTGDSTASTTTTTTGALAVTDAEGNVVTNLDGTPVTTMVSVLPTAIRPVTDPSGTTVTEVDGTNKTEVVVPPHITVWTDAEGTTHTSLVPEQMVTTATTATTSTTVTTVTTSTTTTTTKPPQQEVADGISLPAEGYAPDNRIRLGAVSHNNGVVTMVIRNISGVWESEEGKSYFEYTCYDKNNGVLAVDKIEFGYIPVKSSKTCSFTIPANTVKVVLTDFKAEYWSKPI